MRVVLVVVLAFSAVILGTASQVSADDTIRIWKIGSPHRGDIPAALAPAELEREVVALGFSLVVQAFPAKGFAATFRDAVARNAAPDVLSFDNFGVMTGITTALGTFEGIGDQAAVQKAFVRVTGTFDDLLGPERGWNFLAPSSANHKIVKALALKEATCPTRSGRPFDGELSEIVPRLAAAFVEGNAFGLQGFVDAERLLTVRSRPEATKVSSTRACSWWGNDKLAVAQAHVSYEGESTVGQTPVLLVLRKSSSGWRLLVASRDPITHSVFWQAVPFRMSRLSNDQPTSAMPVPATLLSPEDGRFPQPANGERFGTFEWQSSASADIVAEIVEFAYDDDARLFFQPVMPGSKGQLSAGQLWTTKSLWIWRVWSIARTGDIAFSNAWTFPN
jgi:hypothetical protein